MDISYRLSVKIVVLNFFYYNIVTKCDLSLTILWGVTFIVKTWLKCKINLEVTYVLYDENFLVLYNSSPNNWKAN